MLKDYEIDKPVLETDRLIIRTLTQADVPDLKEWLGRDEIYTYWGRKASKGEKNPELMFIDPRPWVKRKPSPDFDWGIVLKDSNKVEGMISVFDIQNARMGDIAYRVNPDYWNMRITTEALKEVVRFIFKNTEIERLNGRADVRNIASNKVLERCGFIKEGTIRQGKMVSVYCDYNIYGMLREALCRNAEEKIKMKYQYKEMPESMKGTYGEFSKNFGFDWKEFIMGIPTPMFLVTTYKSNGQPNATMQSWAGFTSANHGGGYYVILCSVNKSGHLYQSLNEKKVAVLNFMSSDLYKACMKTIQNNQFEKDEITSSGLTVEKASWIEAPMVAECFMNLECQYLWEKEIVAGDDHVMICLEVVGGHIEKDYMEDMFGAKGVLYNVHYPINPEAVKEKGCDFVAALKKVNQSYEY